MAYLTKDARGRSPFWLANYTDASGRRLRKSTKTKNRDVALRMALQLERAARLAGSEDLTEFRARELISELLEQITDGKESVRVQKVGQFLGEWLKQKRELLGKGSLWTYDAAVGGFLEFLGPRVSRPLTSIQPGDLQSFVSELKRQQLSPKTISVYLKVLRSAFKSARLQQLITFNPAEAVDLPKGEAAERGTFTPAEVSLLIGCAPTDD
ncbi:MAG: phage integrase N-terminal SAM-like domain-containing protein, partial [Verrucomicrobiales bacterium]|nr:phage integrase N-terminal SAM-like domain-containing protein [Verrucomicrobiales bacterium]